MDVLEVAPGPWRWTGYHEEWKEDVGSVLYATSDGVVLVDPIVPPEDTDRFWLRSTATSRGPVVPSMSS